MGKFLRIECECGERYLVFSNSTTKVVCSKCGKVLVEPTGGRAKINGRILEVL